MNKIAPENFTGLRISEPKDTAAGMPAILESVRFIFSNADVVRGTKALLKLNQKDGYDCPSCAWPDPDGHRSPIAEYCESGAKAVADEIVTKHTAGPVLFQRYSVEELRQKSDLWLGQQGRLTQPMIVRPGATHYEPIDWKDAFQLIGDQLNGLQSPDEAIFYTSGRTSNEAAFLYQLFVRMYGTNNLPDCSNMCHESTSVALAETIGLGKASIVYDDFEKADVIMIMGQNPGTNAPRMMTPLEAAKRNGATIIAVNPLFETGLKAFVNPQSPRDMLLGGQKLTDIFVQIKINTDMAFLKAICILLLEEEKKAPGKVIDWPFIKQYTKEHERFIESLSNYTVEDLAKQCGLTVEKIQEVVDKLKYTQKIIICWAMGLTQHRDSVQTIQEVINLLLLKGSIGIEGGGAAPIRGHSNVQGDRTMGIWEKPKPEFLDKLKEVFGFEPPREEGHGTVDAVKAMHEGRATVFFGMGGNFLMAVSDTNYTADALQKCDLTVQVSTKLNRSHLIHGKTAIILPCLGRSDQDKQATGEQFVTTEGTTGVVQQSKGMLEPVSEHLKSEPAIIAALAKATLGEKSTVNWDQLAGNYDHIRDLIEKVVPGFEKYNERVRHPGGFYLPNGPRERRFPTTNVKESDDQNNPGRSQQNRAIFTINVPQEHPLKENELLLMTIRSHDQFNTTIYGMNDRYRGVHNERRVIFMNQKDITRLGLKVQQVVDMHSHYGGVTRTAARFIVVSYDIPAGNAAAYYPETNVLVPIENVAEKSLTPTSKSIIITVTESK
ncbi:FdhF/YdeP family oxidoreductase [Tellurirhabdus bombi]|uniref:FdhF/YdeP family oxidoreductase n=1 Tax=Tellurirhabdus bombi TaxID=2907205 RepID=UPI001F37A463|nr:FdhF/YdeP family oxidoreductase [Tellurirhabdus bombi]